jgi:precorrin-2/cobalt-factor-2 C20-methyltransferase
VRLLGLGVGPGDPDLLTLVAVRELSTAGRVFVPVADLAEPGHAERVVVGHVPPSRLERLLFLLADPVDGAQERRRDHWTAAAGQVVSYLDAHGGTAVFATLGDPSVYSTFTYLADAVRALRPEVRIEMSPGVTAMQATACAAGVSLVEGAEPLTVVPLTRDVTVLTDVLARGGTVVTYKGGRRLEQLREVIDAAGALERSVYAENVGTSAARVVPLADLDPGSVAPYLSTVIVLPPRRGRGEQL